MCGRYVNISTLKAIEKRFGVSTPEPELYHVNANVAAGQLAPVITDEHPDQLQFYAFGFTPFWAAKRMYVLNARSEGDHNKDDDPRYAGAKGIISKPMFRKSVRSKRCLVIADAFIEGPQKEKLSKPYCVYLKDGERPFAFAGLWDRWVDEASGEIVHSFAIITTVANELLRKIGHHRSPVVLKKEDESTWLDPGTPLSDITKLMQALPGAEMNAYPIDKAIKDVRNEGMDLLKPCGERVSKEYEYVLYQDLALEGMGATRARQRRLFDDE